MENIENTNDHVIKNYQIKISDYTIELEKLLLMKNY